MLLMQKLVLLGILIGSIQITNCSEDEEKGNEKRKRDEIMSEVEYLCSLMDKDDLDKLKVHIRSFKNSNQPEGKEKQKYNFEPLAKHALGYNKINDHMKFTMLSSEHKLGHTSASLNKDATILKSLYNDEFNVKDFEKLHLPRDNEVVADLADDHIYRYRIRNDPMRYLLKFLEQNSEELKSLNCYEFSIDIFPSHIQLFQIIFNCNVEFSVASINTSTKEIRLKYPFLGQTCCLISETNRYLPDMIAAELDNTVKLLLNNNLYHEPDAENLLHKCIKSRYETFCGKVKKKWNSFKNTITYLLTKIKKEGDVNKMPLNILMSPFQQAVTSNNIELIELMLKNNNPDLKSKGTFKFQRDSFIGINFEKYWPNTPVNIIYLAVLGGIHSTYSYINPWNQIKETLTILLVALGDDKQNLLDEKLEIKIGNEIGEVDVGYFVVKYCELEVVKLLIAYGKLFNYETLCELISEEDNNMKYLKTYLKSFNLE